jgi:hypothetical protein
MSSKGGSSSSPAVRHSKVFPSAISLEHLEFNSGFAWSNETKFWENCKKKILKSKYLSQSFDWKNYKWKDALNSVWNNELNSDEGFWGYYLRRVGSYELVRLVIHLFVLSFTFQSIDTTFEKSREAWQNVQELLLTSILESAVILVSLAILQLDSGLILAIFGMPHLNVWKCTSYLVLMANFLHMIIKGIQYIVVDNQLEVCDPNTGLCHFLLVCTHCYEVMFYGSVPFPHPFTFLLSAMKLISVMTVTSKEFACVFHEYSFAMMCMLRLATIALLIAAISSNHSCLTSARKVYQLQSELQDMQHQKNDIIDWVVSELNIPLQYIVSPVSRLMEDYLPSATRTSFNGVVGPHTPTSATTTGGNAQQFCSPKTPTAVSNSYFADSLIAISFHCHVIKLMASNTLLRTKLVEMQNTSERKDVIELAKLANSVMTESYCGLNMTRDFVFIVSDLDICHSDKVCMKAVISNLLYCASIVAKEFRLSADTPRTRAMVSHSLDRTNGMNSQTLRSRNATASLGSGSKRAENALNSGPWSQRYSSLFVKDMHTKLIQDSISEGDDRSMSKFDLGIAGNNAHNASNSNLNAANANRVTLKFSASQGNNGLRTGSAKGGLKRELVECKLEISLSYADLEAARSATVSGQSSRRLFRPIDPDSTVFLTCKTIANSHGGSVSLQQNSVVVTMMVNRIAPVEDFRPMKTIDKGDHKDDGSITDNNLPRRSKNHRTLEPAGPVESNKSYTWIRSDYAASHPSMNANCKWMGGAGLVRVAVANTEANLEFIITNVLKTVGIANITQVQQLEERLSDLSAQTVSGVGMGLGFFNRTEANYAPDIDFDVVVTSMPAVCRDVKLKWRVPVVLFHGGVEYLGSEVLQFCNYVVPIPCLENDLNKFAMWLRDPGLRPQPSVPFFRQFSTASQQADADYYEKLSNLYRFRPVDDDEDEDSIGVHTFQSANTAAVSTVPANDSEKIRNSSNLIGAFGFSARKYWGMLQFESRSVEENFFVWIFLYSHDFWDYVTSILLTLVLLLILLVAPSVFFNVMLIWRVLLPFMLLIMVFYGRELYPLLQRWRISLRNVITCMILSWLFIGVIIRIALASVAGSHSKPTINALVENLDYSFVEALRAEYGGQTGFSILCARFYSLVELIFCCSFCLPWPSHLIIGFFIFAGEASLAAGSLVITDHKDNIFAVILVSFCILVEYSISLYYNNVLHRKEYQQWRIGLLTDEFLEQSVSSCIKDTKDSIGAIFYERNNFFREMKKGILAKRLLRSNDFLCENVTSLHKGFNHLTILSSQLTFRDEAIQTALSSSRIVGQSVSIKPGVGPIPCVEVNINKIHPTAASSTSAAASASVPAVGNPAPEASSPFALCPPAPSLSLRSTRPSSVKESVCVRRELIDLVSTLLSCESETVNTHIQVHPMLTCVNLDKRVLQVCVRYAINQSIKNLSYRKRMGTAAYADSSSIGAAAWGGFGDDLGVGADGLCVRELVVVAEPFDRLKIYRFGDIRLMKLTVMDSGLLNEEKARSCINRMQCEELIRQYQNVDWFSSVDCPSATAEDCIFRVEPIRSDYYCCRFVCTIPYRLNSRSVFGRQATHLMFGAVEPLPSLHKLLNSSKIRDILAKYNAPRSNIGLVQSFRSINSANSSASSRNNYSTANSSKPVSRANYALLNSDPIGGVIASDNDSDIDGASAASYSTDHPSRSSRHNIEGRHGKKIVIYEVPMESATGDANTKANDASVASQTPLNVNNALPQVFASHGWSCLRTSDITLVTEAIQHNDIDCVLYIEPSVAPILEHSVSGHRRKNISKSQDKANYSQSTATIIVADAAEKRKQSQRYEFVARLRFIGFNKIIGVLVDSTDIVVRSRGQQKYSMFDHTLVRPVLNLNMDELVDKIDAREIELILRLFVPTYKLSLEDDS